MEQTSKGSKAHKLDHQPQIEITKPAYRHPEHDSVERGLVLNEEARLELIGKITSLADELEKLRDEQRAKNMRGDYVTAKATIDAMSAREVSQQTAQAAITQNSTQRALLLRQKEWLVELERRQNLIPVSSDNAA